MSLLCNYFFFSAHFVVSSTGIYVLCVSKLQQLTKSPTRVTTFCSRLNQTSEVELYAMEFFPHSKILSLSLSSICLPRTLIKNYNKPSRARRRALNFTENTTTEKKLHSAVTFNFSPTRFPPFSFTFSFIRRTREFSHRMSLHTMSFNFFSLFSCSFLN